MVPASSAAEIVMYTQTRNIVKRDNQPCRFKRSLPPHFPARTRFLSLSYMDTYNGDNDSETVERRKDMKY